MTGDGRVILVIDDDPNARAVLQLTLGQHGFQAVHASTGAAGLAATEQHQPSVVLLDLGLPDMHGVEVTERLRERSWVPIIIISARDQEADKVAALDGGANDYLTKPFLPGELMARIRVALRSSTRAPQVPETGMASLGELSFDFDRRRVTRAGTELPLTPIEYRLLALLVGSEGRVLTHKQILQRVWGARHVGQMNSLRVYMKKLRHKIEPEPARPRLLVNVPGVGYRIVIPE